MKNVVIICSLLVFGIAGCKAHGVFVSFDEEFAGYGDTDTAGGSDDTDDLKKSGGTDPDSESDTRDTSTIEVGGCGDGMIQLPEEACDDLNNESGDGCAFDCSTVEANFDCPIPGQPCVSLVVCGDGKIGGAENCDDLNGVSGDGCAADCTVELGWQCPIAGQRCEAIRCGDGHVAGLEECEDGDDPAVGGDGCSALCKVEPGWACDTDGPACHPTVCNDGFQEGDEPCDDGDLIVGNGCNPFCQVEPDCSGGGACSSACGDGMILPGDAEDCDDGNTKNGDGCSEDCEIEPGFDCTLVYDQLADTLDVPATFRDFNRDPTGGYTQHPDFEVYSGSNATTGMVEQELSANGKPIYTGLCEAGSVDPSCPYGAQTTSEADFDQWYNDDTDVNFTLVSTISLGRDTDDDSYKLLDPSFYPVDDFGWVALGAENTSDTPTGPHNFGFTSEVRYWFEYKGGESLYFSGDDDVWVFINNKLALDLGGLHPERNGSVTLDTDYAQDTDTGLGLEVGKIYETALFHAERHTNASNFNLTLTGFVSASSECVTDCGDGIVAGTEICDVPPNDGSYGSCLPGCIARGPFCGDDDVDTDHEECDNGTNLDAHTFDTTPGCAPDCTWGAYCGDGTVDGAFGEVCDDGVNDGGYNACGAGCQINERCGDGVLQEEHGEECDDGNLVSGDGCTKDCFLQILY